MPRKQIRERDPTPKFNLKGGGKMRARRSEKKKEKSNAIYAVALLLIIIFGLTLSTVFFVGPSFLYWPDNFNYAYLAYNTYLHPFSQPMGVVVLQNRYILIYWMAFFYWLFSPSPVSASFAGLSAFALTILVIYKIGSLLHSRKAGLLSALFYSFYPLASILAADVTANVPSALFASLSALFILKGLKSKEGRQVNYLLSAFFSFVGYLVDAVTLVMLSFLGILLLVELVKSARNRSLKEFAGEVSYFIAGLLIAFILIAGLDVLFSGNPLTTLWLTGNPYPRISTTPTSLSEFFVRFSSYIGWLLPYNIVYKLSHTGLANFSSPGALFQMLKNYTAPPYDIALWSDQVGFFGYFTIACILFLAAKREKSAYFPALWFFSTLLYLAFGTVSITSYLPIPNFVPRFMMIFAPAMALLIGIAFTVAIELKQKGLASSLRYGTVIVAFLFLLLTSIVTIHYVRVNEYVGVFPLQQLSDYVHTLPVGTTLYYESHLRAILPVYVPSGYKLQEIGPPFNCSLLPANSYIISSQNNTLEATCGLQTLFAPEPSPDLSAYGLVIWYGNNNATTYMLRVFYHR